MIAPAVEGTPEHPGLRRWQNLSGRLAIGLAFADASIVVLALPQIVDHLHTSISHAVWVIVAYNLALIAGCLAILPLADRIASVPALLAGLLVFGGSSLGCGAADTLSSLIAWRCLQGLGGALVLCASLPLLAGVARSGDSPLVGWSAAAAVGAAVGPAVGGVLTEAFVWRSIFFAQAPVAAVAALAVVLARPRPVNRLPASPTSAADLDPRSANLGLAFLSAGLIGALFLVVVELINAWLVSPLAAAAIVTTIPVATALAERVVRGRAPLLLGGAGALLLAAGLILLSAASHRALGLVIGALALCGAGIGVGIPSLTAAALRSRGSASARAARTVTARHAGLVLGLLLLTPVFVTELDQVRARATAPAAAELLFAPIPISTKLQLVPALRSAVAQAPASRPPDLAPVFDKVGAGATPEVRVQLDRLEARLNAIIQSSVTRAFRRPLLYAAVLTLLVLPLLGLRSASVRTRRPR